MAAGEQREFRKEISEVQKIQEMKVIQGIGLIEVKYKKQGSYAIQANKGNMEYIEN